MARSHIVDVLIAERAPVLAGSPIWPVLRPLLYLLLGYAKARRLADTIAPMSGRLALEHASTLLALKVAATGLEHVPRTGRVVMVCNHPTGIADGIAAYDALKAIRPDVCFFANADAFRVCPGFGDVLIPVEWVVEKRTRERARFTLERAREAFEAERCVVIFPSGRLARRHRPGSALTEEPWATSALSMARKYAAPVVPLHLDGPNSTLFHLFNRFSGELRDITLFHELLNKRGGRFHLVVGPPIPPGALEADAAKATERVKTYVIDRLAPKPG